MPRYEQIRFRPEDARRSRTVILRDPATRGAFVSGVEVGRDGDEITSRGADQRVRMIDRSLITNRQPMIMDLHYAQLVPADTEDDR